MAKTHKGRAKRRITKKRSTRRGQRSIGGGWSDDSGRYIAGVPGQQEHIPYSGAGKDCAGSPLRPGLILAPLGGSGGLPGMSGGFRGGEGAAIGRGMDQTTGASAELKQIMGAAAGFANGPGAMRGGRYSMDPNGAAAFSSNGVGLASYAGIGRAPCELGSQNSLNPNPGGIQQLSTRPADMAGWSRTVNPMGGGMRRTRRMKKSLKRGGAMPLAGAPVVHVGAVDSMAYNAPTAGYGNMPLAPAVMNNPGILMQVPYDARAFNQACIKTGGGGPVAAMAGRFEAPTVADYMGKAVLPVKWGGKRGTRRSLKRGGAWVRADPTQIMLTPGSPVASQAGAFPAFQRIPLEAVSAGMPLNTVPQAGGKRKNKRRANRRANTQ